MVGLIDLYSNLCFTGRTAEDMRDLLDRLRSSSAKQPEISTGRAPVQNIARRLGSQNVDQLLARYQSGESTESLAAEFGVSNTAVKQLLARRGLLRARRLMQADHVAKAVELYEGGQPLSDLEQRLGFNQETIRKQLLKAGVILRPATTAGVKRRST